MGTKNWLQAGKWQSEHSLSTGAGVVRRQEASLLGSTREGSSGGRPQMKRSQNIKVYNIKVRHFTDPSKDTGRLNLDED